MTEHLSSLQLDEIAAGLVTAPEHVSSCTQCAESLAVLRVSSSSFLARPEAQRQMKALLTRRSLVPVFAVAASFAAAVVLFLAWPQPTTGDRLKGSPTVMLLDESGQPVTHAPPGSKLTLAVGTAGFSRVRVFATDDAGKKDELYRGAVSPGARVPLMQLEVSPGDVTVTAEFESETEQRVVSTRLAVP